MRQLYAVNPLFRFDRIHCFFGFRPCVALLRIPRDRAPDALSGHWFALRICASGEVRLAKYRSVLERESKENVALVFLSRSWHLHPSRKYGLNGFATPAFTAVIHTLLNYYSNCSSYIRGKPLWQMTTVRGHSYTANTSLKRIVPGSAATNFTGPKACSPCSNP